MFNALMINTSTALWIKENNTNDAIKCITVFNEETSSFFVRVLHIM